MFLPIIMAFKLSLHISITMKRLFCFLLLLTVVHHSFSQDVHIEFSVHYENMYNDFLDTVSEVPFLDITYRNETARDIYFNKIGGNSCYPSFVSTSSLNISYEVYKSEDHHKMMAFNHSDYSEDFIVEIGTVWVALDSTQRIDEEIMMNAINDDLFNMYNWKELEEEQNCYIKSSETDFSLIFLKAGESYTDSYNLMAFYINKGSFTFKLSSSYKQNIIIRNCWNNSDKQYSQVEISLPEKINQYHRYDGDFTVKETTL